MAAAGRFDDAALEARIFTRPSLPASSDRALPKWATLHHAAAPADSLRRAFQGGREGSNAWKRSQEVHQTSCRWPCGGGTTAGPGSHRGRNWDRIWNSREQRWSASQAEGRRNFAGPFCQTSSAVAAIQISTHRGRLDGGDRGIYLPIDGESGPEPHPSFIGFCC